MPKELVVSAHYSEDADRMFARARSFDDMISATKPLAVYKGLPRADMEEGRTYITDITVLGVIKCPDYAIAIEELDHSARVMRSLEGNEQVKSWEHTLTVEPHKSGATWTDRVIIDANGRTTLLAHYARLMYLRRHKNRRAKAITASLRSL